MGCTTPKEGTYRLEVEINSNETHGMMGRIKRPLCQCHSTQVDHFSSTHFYSSAPCTYTTATGPGRSRRNQQAALSAGRSPMDRRPLGRPPDRPTTRATTMPPQKSRTTRQQQKSGHGVFRPESLQRTLHAFQSCLMSGNESMW